MHSPQASAHMFRIRWLALFVVFLLPARLVLAQPDVSLSGTAFGDYYYILSSPDEEAEEMNGFTIRRMYLTADFDLSRGFTGRARLEANSGNVSTRGMDAFVKDLYVRWQSSSGHAVRIGILPIPHWEDSAERVWAHRALEATVMDLFGIAASRDMGVRVDGPLLDDGRLEYTLMVGNNNGVRPENDRGKRIYGALLSRPSEHVVLSASFDYAGYTDQRERGITAHAFAGYQNDRLGAGVEPFWNRIELTNDGDVTTSGVSLFAHAKLANHWRVIGRFDLAEVEAGAGATFALIALSFEPIPNARFLPNVWIMKQEGADSAEVLGRLTFEFSF